MAALSDPPTNGARLGYHTEAPQAEQAEPTHNRPTGKIKVSNGIEVASWSKDGKYGEFETASISRS